MAVRIASIFDLTPDEIFYHYYEKEIKKNKTLKRDLKVISYFPNV